MFMSTGIESWTPIKEVTVLSPFSGSEYVLTIIVVAIGLSGTYGRLSLKTAHMKSKPVNCKGILPTRYLEIRSLPKLVSD